MTHREVRALKEARAAASARLGRLTVDDRWQIAFAWRPPIGPTERARTRWRTWSAYLAWWQVHREAYEIDNRRFAHHDRPFFADRALAFRDRFGADALEKATIEVIATFDP